MIDVRRVAERLSRGRTFWRRLPAPFSSARVRVTPDAALSILRWGSGWVDGELMSVVSDYVKPGFVVWDIGANLGIFGAAAAVAAGQTGSVLCVEPDIFLAKLIRQTASKLPPTAAQLSVLPAAVAGEFGVARFQIAERGRASNALAEFGNRGLTGGIRETLPVPVVTLDGLLNLSAPPDVIKVDVEGAEGEILRGSARVLNEVRPVIYIEVGAPHVETVTGVLQAANYELFDPAAATDQRVPIAKCTWNTLAIPRPN